MARHRSRGHDPRQQDFDLPSKDAARQERLNDLYTALLIVECDKHLAALCEWVFNFTAGGSVGELKRTYDELAARPRGLCCSRAKARKTVEWATAERLLALHVHRRYDGAQEANGLSIDWDGVRAIKLRPGRSRRGALGEHGGALGEHGGALARQGDALPQHLLKEQSSSLPPNNLFSSPSSDGARRTPGAGGGGAAGGLVLVRVAKATPGPALAEPPADALAWQAIGRRLEGLGVYADLCESLLVKARCRGATPADVAALADHFESRPQAWTGGALAIALKRWSPGQAYDAAALWPPPSDEYRKAAHREAAGRLAAAEAAEERNRAERLDQERQRAATRDAQLGPVLDALLEDELLQLIGRTPRAMYPCFERARKQRPIAGMLREELLIQLAQEAQAQPTETNP